MTFELYEYQQEGVDFLKGRNRALLFDDPGLGKTCQALTALSEEARAIVVCPASVKGVWESECKKWRQDLTPVVLDGRHSFRYPQDKEVIILNYDILSDFPVGEKARYQVILDEVHSCKSTQTLRSKRIKLLRNFTLGNKGTIWGLTGTPILSRPDDLWGILSALGLEKDAFFSFTNFLRIFNGVRVDYGKRFSKIVWKQPTSEAYKSIVKVGLGRRREEVLQQLPTKSYEVYRVQSNLSFEDMGRIYDSIVDTPGALATFRKDLCIEKTINAMPFLDVLSEEGPLVIFTTHKESAAVLAARFQTLSLTGDTLPEKRNEIVSDFQSGKNNVVVGTIYAMGVGLTLTRANRVVFICRDWTPALNKQAEDRVCRIGQTRGVIVTDILADHPVEELVYKSLLKKQEIIDESVEKAR